MRIKRKKNLSGHKFLYLGSALLFTVLAFSVCYAVGIFPFQHSQSKPENPLSNINKVNYSKATNDQIQEGNSIKKQSADNSSQTGTSGSITIQSINAYQVSSSAIHATVIIANDLNSGTCTLTISKDSVVKTYSTTVTFSGTYSSCKGFDIPTADLGTNIPGTWNVAVTVTSGSATGTAATTVEVQS